MEPARGVRSGLFMLFAALSLLLAVAGNLLGNVIAETVPDDWTSRAPTLLAGTVTLYLIVNVAFAFVQDAIADNWRKAQNRRIRLIRLILLVFDTVLAAAGGVLSNLAATNLLPHEIVPFAPWLYIGVVLLALAISFSVLYFQSSSKGQEFDRRELMERLRDRYETLRSAALQGEQHLTMDIAWKSSPPTHTDLPGGKPSVAPQSSALPFFDTSKGHLLLLGQPGAGKTVLLAELGLDLLRRAWNDPLQPVPIIFPLSTWAVNRESLANWLVESLAGPPNYMKRKLAEKWVSDQTILPLLDGLDEVGDTSTRDAAVDAINAFHAAYPHLPLVVTSREQEYLEQAASLTLPHAVVLPLSDLQIHTYLQQAGTAYAVLEAAVDHDSALRELLRTPLLLRVVMRTYRDIERPKIPSVGDHEAWMHELFRDYVAQMLKHRSESTDEIAPYAPSRVVRYLAWLATEMQVHQVPEFYPVQLSTDWLEHVPAAKKQYSLTSSVVYALLLALTYGFVARQFAGPLIVLLVAILGGLPILVVPGLASKVGEYFSNVAARLRKFVGALLNIIWRTIPPRRLGLMAPIRWIQWVLFFFPIYGAFLVVTSLLALPWTILATLQNLLLRWALRRAGVVPDNYGRFLDYASSHVLLQKIGTGYRYIHPLLRDYFADQYPITPKSA